MNRLIFTLILLFILIAPQAWGQTTSQYPNPYRQTMWNNITDSVHTLGQNPQQTKTTIRKLHNARTKVRVQGIIQANKAKRKAWVASNN